MYSYFIPLNVLQITKINFSLQTAKRKIWRCRVCKKVVSSRTSLAKHKRDNTGCQKDREYHCRCCQLGFANRGLLDVHYKETPCGTSEHGQEVITHLKVRLQV